MHPPELIVTHARNRLQHARDHARAMRLHPPLRVRLSRGLRGLAERLEPGIAGRYVAASYPEV